MNFFLFLFPFRMRRLPSPDDIHLITIVEESHKVGLWKRIVRGLQIITIQIYQILNIIFSIKHISGHGLLACFLFLFPRASMASWDACKVCLLFKIYTYSEGTQTMWNEDDDNDDDQSDNNSIKCLSFQVNMY